MSAMMEFFPFHLDIDELVNEFAEGELTTLADMKKIWLAKKFTYIYKASPAIHLAYFMQSLYSHAIGYMVGTGCLQLKLGGFYCLYCLYETQLFKPPFKIYLSLGELKKLKSLVIEANQKRIEMVPVLVKIMLEKHFFLFGSSDLHEDSVSDTFNQARGLHNARVEAAYCKLFADPQVEQLLQMDMGLEFDLSTLKKMSMEYVAAKQHVIEEATSNGIDDVEDIWHIAEDERSSLGAVVEKIVENWNVERELFHQQTGLKRHPYEQNDEDPGDNFPSELESKLLENC